jgi:hypothetical protein
MFSELLESIFEPVFLTIGVLFFRAITLGKFPSIVIKEKYKILFVLVGLLVSIFVLYFVYTFFFKS